MRLAYLCSHYPAVSHTFVLREVEALRSLGVGVETFTVRRSEPKDVLAFADREAFRTTTALLPVGAFALVGNVAAAMRLAPHELASGVWNAVRSAGGLSRTALWRAFYVLEGILLWRAMLRRDLRHVHVHFANPAVDVARAAVAFGCAIDGSDTWTYSFTLHGPSDLVDTGPQRLADKASDARFVVCISDYARSQAMALLGPEHWPKLHVVRCGGRRRELRTLSGFRVLNVGRLAPVKGQLLLVEAVAALNAAGVATTLAIVGEGPMRRRLEEAAVEVPGVELLGAVGQDDIQRLYRQADAFCLPSFAEGVPVVLMEAMALELPVVATRVAGVSELVEEGVSGFLVRPGRVEPLTGALADLAADATLRRRMGQAGRDRVKNGYDVYQNARELRDVLIRYGVGGSPPSQNAGPPETSRSGAR